MTSSPAPLLESDAHAGSQRADDHQSLLLTAAVGTRLTRHRNQALTVDRPDLAYRPHTATDDLTTTEPSAPDHVRNDLTTTEPSALKHVRDDLTSTATAIATAIANVLDDNPEILSRHWHPAVPFPGAAGKPAAAEPGAAPC